MKVVALFVVILIAERAQAGPEDRLRERGRGRGGWRRGRPTPAPPSPPQQRQERMPKNKRVRFRMGEDTMDLNLTKSDRVTYLTPIIQLENLKVKLRDEPTADKEFGVYQDSAKQASLILAPMKGKNLRRSDAVEYSGYFMSKNKMYELKMRKPDPPGRVLRARPSSLVDTTIDDTAYDAVPIEANQIDFEDRVVMREGMEDYLQYKEKMLRLAREIQSARSDAATVSTPHYVETLLVLDYSVYREWLEFANFDEDDAMQQMTVYYAHVINGVDMRFNSIEDPDYSIYVRLSYILVAKTINDSPWTEAPNIKEGGVYTHAYRALDAFEEWLATMKNNLPPFDQATLFTNNHLFSGLRSDGSRRTISGLADIMGICMPCPGRDAYCGASINHDFGIYANTQTATHEMGHNLGSFHDSNPTYAPSCSGRDQYIMASAPSLLTDETYKNAFTFSPCSIYQFRNHFTLLQTTNTNCMSNYVEHFDRNLFKYLTQRSVGQDLNPDQQCQLIYGDNSYYCGGGTRDERICREMRCWDPKERLCVTDRIRSELRAADGTICGNQKWCLSGDCIESKSAPVAPDRCIYGDYRGIVIREPSLTCQQMVNSEPWRCYDKVYGLECCESCDAIKNNDRPGCEYGDLGPPSSCQNVVDRYSVCYDQTTERLCCASCYKHYQPDLGKGCEYGDHATWCPSLYDRECYYEETICCATCQRRRRDSDTCRYGDSLSYCNSILDRDCYRDDFDISCCDTCARRKNGPDGCEWGDRVPGCDVSECTDASRHVKCCRTCEAYIETVTTTQQPTTTTTIAIPVNPMCPDRADYCATMPARDCYYYYDTCCDRCSKMEINLEGCNYGDKVSWCGGYVTSKAHCADPDIKDLCCKTCLNFEPTVPTIPPEPPCENNADWCDRSNFIPGWCYSSTTEKTCCATCRRLKTGKAGCEYGDKYSWCKPVYCNTNREDCCIACQ